MSNDNVAPYTQARQTKLGLATITITQVEDLFEATVNISYGNTIFKAEGIFSSARESFLWAYGTKQTRNDRYAGYTSKENLLVETSPKKGKIADTLTKVEALIESQSDYDNFSLAKSSNVAGDKVSMSAVKASTLLSDEDKAIMAGLFAKMGKVTIA